MIPLTLYDPTLEEWPDVPAATDRRPPEVRAAQQRQAPAKPPERQAGARGEGQGASPAEMFPVEQVAESPGPSDAFHAAAEADGYRAALALEPRDGCPYPYGSVARHHWMRGFENGQGDRRPIEEDFAPEPTPTLDVAVTGLPAFTGFWHPAAAAFPMMGDDELAALAADMKARGFDPRHPVLLLPSGDGLDGRNRLKAALLADVAPVFALYEGADPIGHVVAENVRRRHMDESQRALVASRFAQLPAHRPDAALTTAIAVFSQPAAAKAFNVSVDSIQRARKVTQHGAPALIEAVERGRLSVAAASEVAMLPHAEQEPLAADPEKAVAAAATRRNQRKAGVLVDAERRRDDDFNITGPGVTEALLRVEAFTGLIREPACGNGAIAAVLSANQYGVVASDLNDHGHGETGVDFLALDAIDEPNIVTNPPFRDFTAFARKAVALVDGRGKVALLAPLNYLAGKERKALFDETRLARVWVFSERQDTRRAGWEPTGNSSTMNLMWLVWDPDHEGPAVMGWL